MGQVLFIVWRESVEAMLLIGILHAWLAGHPQGARGRAFLWGGVAAGFAVALMLGAAILAFAGFFQGDAQDYFQLSMVLAAAALIVQMVFWMRKHGRTLRRELEAGLAESARRANWWGMLLLAALAVGREGSETVVFLWGLGVAQQGMQVAAFAAAALAGFALAFATFWLLQAGSRVLSWHTFFRLSEAMLLLLAGALLVGGVERLISLGWLPGLVDPLWDSSAWLDDNRGIGGLLAALTGYRAQPSLTALLALVAYWAAVPWGLRRVSRSGADASLRGKAGMAPQTPA